MLSQVAVLRKGLIAARKGALKRLFASMGAMVVCQGLAIPKAPLAIAKFAREALRGRILANLFPGFRLHPLGPSGASFSQANG